MDSNSLVAAGIAGMAASVVQHVLGFFGVSLSRPQAQVLAAVLAVAGAAAVVATSTGLAIDEPGDVLQAVFVVAGTSQMFYNVITTRLPQP